MLRMREERLKVLALLEAGRISASEAANLIKTLAQGEISGERINLDERLTHFVKQAKEGYQRIEPKVEIARQTAVQKARSVLDGAKKVLGERLAHFKR
jgi:predicted Holliday junction resolvase-like endonuclease